MMTARSPIEPGLLPPSDMCVIDCDGAVFSIVARGDVKDVAALVSIEGARDWRPLRAILVRTLSEAWPELKTAPAKTCPTKKGARR
ncbi:MAG: hypothetical protein H5U11_19175 [Rhizobium sp.]|nr:hypothetical protein [Rhizobium sp.]